jgi:hypothetical protein
MSRNNNILEKELLLIKTAIKDAQKNKPNVNNPINNKMFNILKHFLKSTKHICYGGTAINNILPLKEQFYNKNIELPDYDFFSPNARQTSIELADLYYLNNFLEVEAKSGIHVGTYKVFVNSIPVADITQLDSEIFDKLQQNSIIKNGIYYASPNYLRMAAYIELSRPNGDISRWEKVWPRLVLLNKYYPFETSKCTIKDFIRTFDAPINSLPIIYNVILNSIIEQNLIFFGGYAVYSYSKYLPLKERQLLITHPDFDVLAINPLKSATIIRKNLAKHNILNVKIIKHDPIGEIIPEHYELQIGEETLLFLYKTVACYSYNTIKRNNQTINIATIDTMLSFYLAFLFINRDYYNPKRILCLAHYLFTIQLKHRLKQKGILKRFTVKCYGKQETLEETRKHRAQAFLYNQTLYNQPNKYKRNNVYRNLFFRYIPTQFHNKTKKIIKIA